MREKTAEQQPRKDDDDHERNDGQSSAFVLLLVAAAAARRVAHLLLFYAATAGGSSGGAKARSVIRVRIPLDLQAVADNAAAVFAFATPLRVRDVLALAVREAIGDLAPADKFSRSVVRTLDGLYAGDFTLDIDGRTFADPETVVVCGATADVRFFVSDWRRVRARGLPAR